MSQDLDRSRAAKADGAAPIPVLAVTAYAGKGDERIRDAGAEVTLPSRCRSGRSWRR